MFRRSRSTLSGRIQPVSGVSAPGTDFHCTIDRIRSPYISLRSPWMSIPSQVLWERRSYYGLRVSQIQSFLSVRPVDSLVIDFPTFTEGQMVDPTIPVSFSYRGDFLNSHSQKGLLVVSWLPPMPSTADSQFLQLLRSLA